MGKAKGITWRDVGRMASSVAPVLAGALGGPVGAVATAAGTLLASWLGEDKADPATLANRLGDPATLLRLRELEIQEQTKLLEWQAQQTRADLDNTEGARRREVELAKAGHGAAWATTAVAVIVTCGFFWMLYVVIAGKGEDTTSDAALMLLGVMGSGFGAVINYYLGSSLGSSRKTALLSRGQGE